MVQQDSKQPKMKKFLAEQKATHKITREVLQLKSWQEK
jgi:hypothetical protein